MKMRMSSRLSAAVILVGLLFVGAAVDTLAKDECKPKVPALFLFGDSIVDSGNNNYITGYPLLPQANIYPYGETYFHHATGRWSNGRLIFDFIADFLELPYQLPYLQPNVDPIKYKTGVNFASAGSGVLDGTFLYEGVINLSVQLQNYLKAIKELKKALGEEEVDKIIRDSIYVIVSIGNDIGAYIGNTTLQQEYTAAEYIGLVIAKLAKDVQTLVDTGARKIFIGGLGPLGCVPELLLAFDSTGACVALLDQLSAGVDAALLAYVEGLNVKKNGPYITISTQFQEAYRLEENGTLYGFTAGSTACCGSGLFDGATYPACGRGNYTLCKDVEKHVFWDFIHPTERAYKILADLLWFNTTNTYPLTLQQLAALD